MNDQDVARKGLHGLVFGLLAVTLPTLATIESQSGGEGAMTETEEGVTGRQAKLACTFRDNMTTKGQSFKGLNDYRDDFYKMVIESANDVSFPDFPHFGDDDSLSSSWKAFKLSRQDRRILSL